MSPEELATIRAAWESNACRVADGQEPDPIVSAGIIVRVPNLLAEVDRLTRVAAADAEKRAALVVAIRRITVDHVDPSGEPAPGSRSERAIEAVGFCLDPLNWRADIREANAVRIARANGAMAELCEALGDEAQALREAAEAYLGGNFRDP